MNATKTFKLVDSYQIIRIVRDAAIEKEYFDEVGNLCSKDVPLKEIFTSTSANISQNSDKSTPPLLSNSEIQLYEIEKRFVLEKFNRQQNATD